MLRQFEDELKNDSYGGALYGESLSLAFSLSAISAEQEKRAIGYWGKWVGAINFYG